MLVKGGIESQHSKQVPKGGRHDSKGVKRQAHGLEVSTFKAVLVTA